MTDLRARMRVYDQAPAPDYWSEVRLRASAAGGSAVPDRSTRPMLLLAAALLAIVAISAAVAIGSGVIELPRFVVPPVPSPSAPEPSPSAEASTGQSATGVVAYEVLQGDQRIWVVNADGTDAHELLPNASGDQDILGWTPDGSQLLFRTATSNDGLLADVYSTDAAGSEPELICAAEDGDCPFVGGTPSPDGRRLAYPITDSSDEAAASTMAILDLATGEVTRLEATRTTSEPEQCGFMPDGATNLDPSWSPDGTRLMFVRGSAIPNCRQFGIFVVDADGSDFRQLTPDDMVAYGPRWSPDGTRIAFGGDERQPSELLWATDLYTMRSDGSDMRRLTTDGGAGSWNWTREEGIVLSHVLAGGLFDEVRLLSWDGTEESPIDDGNIPDLTAIGCGICPYGPATGESSSHGDAYWQPVPLR
jgi:dipeptidyl aminopeptidase/acylaminoacyl peptidase